MEIAVLPKILTGLGGGLVGASGIATTLWEVMRRNRAASAEQENAAEGTVLPNVTASIETEFVRHKRTVQKQIDARLQEARNALGDYLGKKKWSGFSAILLTVAQYIFGGVLASSFVQQSLSSKFVGVLGLLVLIASIIKQQFHPETTAEEARMKAAQLKGLIRASE